MKNILFVCSQNKLRSPTAESVFSGYPNVNVRSAGLNNNAEVSLGPDDVMWADVIFVMEKAHRRKLKNGYKKYLNDQRVVCLDIPDNYEYMDDDLISILKSVVPRYLT